MSRAPGQSLEATVLAAYPAGAVRVVASREHGDDAYVLLDTRPGGPAYLYGAHVRRDADSWVGGSDSNTGGWGRVDAGADAGTLAEWGEAPASADRVRLTFRADEREEPVEHGVYLAVWWRVPCPNGDRPTAVAFRVNGRWVPTP